jgi:hypothetical protein
MLTTKCLRRRSRGLPILHLIVGPSTHQSANIERATANIGSQIPDATSDTPFIGQGTLGA